MVESTHHSRTVMVEQTHRSVQTEHPDENGYTPDMLKRSFHEAVELHKHHKPRPDYNNWFVDEGVKPCF